jgi:hypothetical protein
LAAQSKSSTQSSCGSTGSSRLAEFLKDLISSVEWPIYTSPSDLRATFTSLHATSQRVLQELTPGARSELLISLCVLYGYHISGQKEFASWMCPVVRIDLPFDLVTYGALIDTQSFRPNGWRLEEAILSIANEAPFVLVLDCADEPEVTEPKQANISIVSSSYLADLIAGILALHYFERVHQEIFQKTAAVNQLKSFLDALGISLETTQLIARKLRLGQKVTPQGHQLAQY